MSLAPSVLNRSDFAWPFLPKDIRHYLETFLLVTTLAELLAPSGEMLSIVQCTGQLPTRKDDLVQNVCVEVAEPCSGRLRQRLSSGCINTQLPSSLWRWRVREGAQDRAPFHGNCKKPGRSLVTGAGEKVSSQSGASEPEVNHPQAGLGPEPQPAGYGS